MCSAFARAWFGKEIDSVNTGKLIPEGAPPRPTCFLMSDWLTSRRREKIGSWALARRRREIFAIFGPLNGDFTRENGAVLQAKSGPDYGPLV